MSATAASGGYDGHGKKHHGWIKVCQDIKKYDDYKDDDYKDDKDEDDYEGRYRVKDSYGSVWKFDLKGKYDCKQVRVRAGKVSVKVLYKPKDTYLKGDEDRYVHVKKNRYEKVTYEYKAVAYGWVKVCQDIKKKKDADKDKGKYDNKYRGTYEVKDSYGDTTTVYLEGKYDCDEVKVRAGKVDVKVIYKPDDTKLKGDEKVYVDVDKDEYEKVTFEYRVKDDDYGDYSRAAHAAA